MDSIIERTTTTSGNPLLFNYWTYTTIYIIPQLPYNQHYVKYIHIQYNDHISMSIRGSMQLVSWRPINNLIPWITTRMLSALWVLFRKSLLITTWRILMHGSCGLMSRMAWSTSSVGLTALKWIMTLIPRMLSSRLSPVIRSAGLIRVVSTPHRARDVLSGEFSRSPAFPL